MRIMIYAHSFAPNVGGAESYVRALAEGLATGERCDSVVLVTQAPPGDTDDDRFPFRVVRQPGLRQLWRLIGDAGVVHLSGPVLWPLLMAHVRGRPLVVEHHAYQAICPNGLLWHEQTRDACPGHFAARRYGECIACNGVKLGASRSARMLLLTFARQWLCRGARANVAVSDHVRSRLRLPHGLTILHGVPETPLVPPWSQKVSAMPCFAYVGRLVEEKGLALLLHAASLLSQAGRPVHVRFIGEGPEHQRLAALAHELSLEHVVQFVGWQLGAQLEAALADVLAVIMPSMWEETAGLSAMEHMMRGGLVIAARTGGLAEMVEEGGWLFERGNAAGLAACMQRAIEEPAEVQAVSMRARQRAMELFAQPRMVSEHRALYARVSAGVP